MTCLNSECKSPDAPLMDGMFCVPSCRRKFIYNATDKKLARLVIRKEESARKAEVVQADAISHAVADTAFEVVMTEYIRIKSSSEARVQNPEHDFDKLGRPRRSCKLVGPSRSDFICDVDLAARAALHRTPILWAMFRIVFIEQRCDARRMPRDRYDEIATRVGRALRARGVYPLGNYFKPRMVGTNSEITNDEKDNHTP